MSGDMCDDETRRLFKEQEKTAKKQTLLDKFIATVAVAILAVVGWGGVQIYEQGKTLAADKVILADLVVSYKAHVAKVPDGFFTKDRYGTEDAYSDQEKNRIEREANHALVMAEITLVDRRIQYLEKLSTKHIGESSLYIQMIKDTATNVKELQKVVWKLVPNGSN